MDVAGVNLYGRSNTSSRVKSTRLDSRVFSSSPSPKPQVSAVELSIARRGGNKNVKIGGTGGKEIKTKLIHFIFELRRGREVVPFATAAALLR